VSGFTTSWQLSRDIVATSLPGGRPCRRRSLSSPPWCWRDAAKARWQGAAAFEPHSRRPRSRWSVVIGNVFYGASRVAKSLDASPGVPQRYEGLAFLVIFSALIGCLVVHWPVVHAAGSGDPAGLAVGDGEVECDGQVGVVQGLSGVRDCVGLDAPTQGG
jgi:hypothetical protein